MDKNTVLLIEDNVDDAALTLKAFKQNSVAAEVILVNNGLEALDYLFGQGHFSVRDLNVMPRLILLDLKLPKLDGFGCLKRLREDHRTKYLPVVILTASNEENDRRRGYEMGANSYVVKPVDFHKFTESIRVLSTYWLNLNEHV